MPWWWIRLANLKLCHPVESSEKSANLMNAVEGSQRALNEGVKSHHKPTEKPIQFLRFPLCLGGE